MLVPWPLTLASGVHVSPDGVEADTARLTTLLNPPTEKTVIVEEPLAPARIVAGVTGPAEIVKSGA